MKAFFCAAFALTMYLGAVAQPLQTIKGVVIDEVSKAPLAGASIVVELNGKPVGTTTAADGSFRLANVPTGRLSLKVSLLNYEDQVLPNIILTAGKEAALTIGLTEKINALTNVVVRGQNNRNRLNNPLSVVSARSFSIEDTKRYAGSLGDPSRMAANFAGVSGANDSRNDIVVRGNAPSGLLWQMEGLNIPNPNHFGSLSSTGGPVSILNNNVLDKSDFLTSAFPATYGNAIAGVFDLKLRNGNPDKHEFLGQMGFNGIEAGAEGPLNKKTKASYLLNYRYSTLALFKALGFSATGEATPYYQDWTARVNIPLNAKSTLSAFSIGGTSNIDFLGNDTDTTVADGNLYGNENENTRVDYFTTISGLTFTHQHNSRVYSKLSLGLSTTNETFEGDSISVVTREAFQSGEAQQKTKRLGISYVNTAKFSNRTSLTSGIMADLLSFDLFNREIYGGGTSDYVNINTSDNTVLLQGYSTLRHRLNQRITLNAGLHVQQLALNNSWAVEPRLGVRYKLSEGQNLSLGYGLHSQMQNIYTYFVQTPTNKEPALTNKELNFTRSHHLVLGYDIALNAQTRLKAETYYQSLFDVPVELRSSSYSALNTGADFGPDNTDSLVNEGTGTNYGIELTLERSFHRGFYGLFTVSLFNSQYKGSDGVERNTAFNTGYVANMLAGKEWIVGKKKAVLGLDLRLSTQGGRYLSPIDAKASAAAGEAVYDQSKAYSQQQSAYFRMDVKLLYRRNFKHTALEVSVDLQNLTNHENVFLQQYNRRTNSIVTQYQQGFFPVPMVRFTF
jgi:hypothetical protein